VRLCKFRRIITKRCLAAVGTTAIFSPRFYRGFIRRRRVHKILGGYPLKKFCFVCLFVIIFSATVSDAFISEKVLNQAGLQTVWQSAVSLNKGEKVAGITILGDYLYILTETNYLFCLDRSTGKLVIASALASPKLPVSAPSAYKNTVYFIAANKLIAFDVQQGTELFRRILDMPVSAAIAANSSNLYIPGMDKRLYVTDPNGQHIIFQATADDVSAATSVLADNSFVIFATDSGKVICMSPLEPKRIWQFNAVGSVSAPLVSEADWIYASSKDTNLYKLENSSGTLAWKFHSGSVLTSSARAAEKVVYQYAINKGLYAIDAESGKQIWLLNDGLDLLAQNGSTSYIFDKDNTCVIMDNTKAKMVGSINFAPVTAYASNTQDAMIYVMSGKNILCIRPAVKLLNKDKAE
jgi:outer membrane protein assembly factor BamB